MLVEPVLDVFSPTPRQDAVALVTLATSAPTNELEALAREFCQRGDTDQLVVALSTLCGSLCLATSRVLRTLDDQLDDQAALDLTAEELRPLAMRVLGLYGHAAALHARPPSPTECPNIEPAARHHEHDDPERTAG